MAPPPGVTAALPPAVVPVTKETLLPVEVISVPAVLIGKSNGQLPPSILASAAGLSGGPKVTLVSPALRGWNAMVADAQSHGIILQSTSTVDSYRPLAVQTAIFHQRYTPTWHGGWATRRCGSITYYQIPGTASAACPGTSNHGLGLAIDVANASGGRLTWLLANAKKYGFSWEIQSEPWHIRYVSGDHIPAAVLKYEEVEGGGDMTTAAEFLAILDNPAVSAKMRAFAWQYVGGGIPTGMSTLGVLNDIYGEVNADLPSVSVDLTEAQLDSIAEKVAEKLTSLRFVATPVDLEP